MGEVFTDDLVYDASDFDQPVTRGIDALRDLWTRPDAPHPLAHHATNIVVTENADGTVGVLSKGLGVGYRGRVGSATYRDVVRHTPDGWRLAHRVATLRRPESIPEPS